MTAYKNNFIIKAILRIDFTKPLDEFSNSIPDDLEQIILKYFTLKELRDMASETVTFELRTSKVNRQNIKFKEWNFFANEKTKQLCLTKDFLFVAFAKYINQEDFVNAFKTTMDWLKTNRLGTTVKRVGMRYINNIRISEDNPTSWDKHIKPDLLCIFKLPSGQGQITRAMHILELNLENDIKMKYQYGMHNPDYPAAIKQKIFVLDLDAYKQGDMQFEEVEYLIPKLHDAIEDLFEESITDDLRAIMNE